MRREVGRCLVTTMPTQSSNEFSELLRACIKRKKGSAGHWWGKGETAPPKTQPLFSHFQLANVHFNRVTSSSFTCHKFAPEGQGILFLFFLFSPSSHKTRYYLGLGQSCPNQLFVRGIIPFRAQVIGLLGLHSQSFFLKKILFIYF